MVHRILDHDAGIDVSLLVDLRHQFLEDLDLLGVFHRSLTVRSAGFRIVTTITLVIDRPRRIP